MTLLRTWFRRWMEDWVIIERPDWRSATVALVGAILLWPLVNKLPMLGYDWLAYFYSKNLANYPPWTEWILWPLNVLSWRSGVAAMNSLLLTTVAISVARQVYRHGAGISHRSLTSEALATAFLALLTPPTLIMMWTANVEAVALWGWLIMPLGIPSLLFKPHLGAWVVLSRRSWVLWALLFGIFSLVFWPSWPFHLMNTVAGRAQHPAAFGWASLGWPILLIGAVLLIWTPADDLLLMAAGSFLSPALMPQHFVLLLPALGRVRGWRRLALWAASWLLALPLMFNGWPKYFALGFPLLAWWFMRAPDKVP